MAKGKNWLDDEEEITLVVKDCNGNILQD